MKKTIVTLSLFLIFSVSYSFGQKDITGKWTPSNLLINGEEVSFFASLMNSECGQTTVEFKSDNTVAFKSWNEKITDEGRDCEEVNNQAKYKLAKGKITIMTGDQKMEGKFTLKEDELTFEYKKDMDGDGKLDTRTEIYTRVK